MKIRKLLDKALRSPKSLRFSEAVRLAEAFGFRFDRTVGSHHIFVHPSVDQLLNLQDEGGQAKAYQIKQLLKLVEQNALDIEERP